jgi:hypothetical protein
MINYNDYEEWPSIEVQFPNAGGRLLTKHGGVLAYVDTDGTIQVVGEQSMDDVESWEVFGITDPVEQVKMSLALDKLITSLKEKRV